VHLASFLADCNFKLSHLASTVLVHLAAFLVDLDSFKIEFSLSFLSCFNDYHSVYFTIHDLLEHAALPSLENLTNPDFLFLIQFSSFDSTFVHLLIVSTN